MPTELPAPRPAGPTPETAPETPPQSPWQGVQGAILLLSLVVLLVLFLLPFLSDRPGRGRPWRVAITTPELYGAEPKKGQEANAPELDEGRRALVRETIIETAERMLAARDGLVADTVLDLPEPEVAEGANRAQRDRAIARLIHEREFDEVLSMIVECSAKRCRTLLRRLRSVDASAEWRRSFSFDPHDSLAVEEELAGELHVAFLKFSRRDGGSRLLADAETYETFLRTRIDQRRGLIPPRRAISIVEPLRQKAPRSTSLHLFEAEMYELGGDKELAADLLAEAHRIAPGDVRPLMRRVPLLLELRRSDEAKVALTQLEAMMPGDPRLLTWREYSGD